MSSDIKKRHVSPKGSIKLIWALNVSHLITLMRFYLNRLQMFNFLLLKCCVNLYPINCLSVFCVSDRQKHMFIYLESALSGSFLIPSCCLCFHCVKVIIYAQICFYIIKVNNFNNFLISNSIEGTESCKLCGVLLRRYFIKM